MCFYTWLTFSIKRNALHIPVKSIHNCKKKNDIKTQTISPCFCGDLAYFHWHDISVSILLGSSFFHPLGKNDTAISVFYLWSKLKLSAFDAHWALLRVVISIFAILTEIVTQIPNFIFILFNLIYANHALSLKINRKRQAELSDLLPIFCLLLHPIFNAIKNQAILLYDRFHSLSKKSESHV